MKKLTIWQAAVGAIVLFLGLLFLNSLVAASAPTVTANVVPAPSSGSAPAAAVPAPTQAGVAQAPSSAVPAPNASTAPTVPTAAAPGSGQDQANAMATTTTNVPPPQPASTVPAAPLAVSTVNASPTVPLSQEGAITKILKIDFRRGENSAGQLIIDLAQAKIQANVQQVNNNLCAVFDHASLPANTSKTVDVSRLNTVVKTVEATAQNATVQVCLTFLAQDYQYFSYQLNNQYVLEVRPKAAAPSNKNAGMASKSDRISLNFQDIKVRSVLQILAEFTGLNIVASDSIKGSITLRLHNIPWQDALAIILRTQGLDKREMGNILLVAPTEEIAAHEKQELMAKQQVTDLEPLVSELIQINYGKAVDIASLLKDKANTLLSSRGNVSVDTRTNTIWIQDVRQKLTEVRKLIKRLDIPVKQVLIEARIVNIDDTYERDLGIRFGISRAKHLSGTLPAANELAQGTDPANVVDADGNPFNRLNVNLPASPTGNLTPTSLGIALAHLGKGILLDLELSALELEGNVEIIANPRLVTADQQEASIESGEEIPYQESTSSGAASIAFKKAVLSLKVTPQITPDGKVVLNLKVNQDSRGEVTAGVPAINTRQMETQVLVDNGETIVLGGIYQQTKSNQIQRVPFLGTLPVVGALFRQKQVTDERRELLIFVTPKIIQQATFSALGSNKDGMLPGRG